MTPVVSTSKSEAVPDREVLIELLGLHAQAMRRMPWVQAWIVVGLGLFIFVHVSGWLFFGWGLLTIAIELVRSRFAAGVLRRDLSVDPYRIHRQFVVLAAVAGAGIAVGAVLFLPEIPIWDQALFAATLLAIPSAGVAVSQSSRFIVAAYSTAILGPAGAVWCLLYPSEALGGSVLIGLMLTVLILVATDGEKLLRRSVNIRHERDRLVRDLEQRNADVRSAMTEVQSAMAQAEQSAQARARVLAAASHDLRQPLHALSVYSAVLASKPAPELLNEVSGNIDQIVRSLGNLLNGLLDLSRLSSGYYVPEHEAVDLGTVIAGVCAEFQHAAAQKSLSLLQDLEPARVLGDPVAIGRIARNLLDNAIKYTDQGTVRITLRAEASNGERRAVLTVADSGKGIPISEHSRIFEEFYQLDNPGRDRSRGVGLGLAIVQRLCELIGATITVESTVGEGTSFRVGLPALLGAAVPVDPSPAQPANAALTGTRIYVVDDEIDILRSMQALLGVWGIEALTADSPAAAERIFGQYGCPDLMIVDLRLGGNEHGAQLADRLRLRYGSFPVLIITGETASEALRQANESGYTLLQKPIAPEVLRRAIASAGHAPAAVPTNQD
jgi:two-component system, sensor histidine kinase